MWKDVLMTLLQAVITVAVPIVATFLCRFLAAKKEELKAKTDNATAELLLDEAYTAIATAVDYVNQTYVDALKKSQQFTVENQKEAFEMAKEAAISVMSTNAQLFIANTFGSFESWITQSIEAQIAGNKKQER